MAVMDDFASSAVSVAQRLEHVRSQIRTCCKVVGRDPLAVTLVAASKGQRASKIREAYEAGQRDFGENFAQELKQKASELSDLRELRWHFIGRFQSNKSNLLVRTGAVVQTVSSIGHLEALAKRSRRSSVRCLVQVSFDDDPIRGGAQVDDVPSIVAYGRNLDGVEVYGLMLVPPQEEDVRKTAAHFARLRLLAESLSLPERSMGMSGDFQCAIEEGSTMVRVGTSIFGPRPALA